MHWREVFSVIFRFVLSLVTASVLRSRLLTSLAALRNSSTEEDMLTELDQRLTRVLERNTTFISEDPPDPDEYRLLKALEKHIPGLKEIKPEAGTVHTALMTIRRDRTLEKLIQKTSGRGQESRKSGSRIR